MRFNRRVIVAVLTGAFLASTGGVANAETAQKPAEPTPPSPYSTKDDVLLGQAEGDYVHVTRNEASGHGWWTTTNPDMKDKTATVTVQLEYLFPAGWKPIGNPGSRSIPPDQTSKRANARVPCASGALGHWRSTVDVDIDWVVDSPGVLVTAEQVRPCRP